MSQYREQQFELALCAVQRGLVPTGRFLTAVSEWLQVEDRSLAEILLQSEGIEPETARELEDLFNSTQATETSGSQFQESRLLDQQRQARLRDALALSADEPSESTADESAPTVDYVSPTEVFSEDAEADAQAKGVVARPATSFRRDGTTKLLGHRFRIISRYKSGGLGVVYKAEDSQLNRIVALKQIKKGAGAGVEESKFYLEAAVTGQLEHPNIVPIYALDVDDSERPFYAMKFIHGRTLKVDIEEFHKTIQQRGEGFRGVQFRRLMRHFIDVCNAIAYAHDRRVLHRDLKPDNIMLGQHGETFVVDWGLAKLVDSNDRDDDPEATATDRLVSLRQMLESADEATVQGTFMGTFGYASPEQLTGRIDQLGPAADVYSLGAILYAIVTGENPRLNLVGDLKAIAEQLKVERPHPRKVRSDVPLALDKICRKAMAYDMGDRYESAKQLADDLERWMADERVLAYGKHEPRLEQAGRLIRKYRKWTLPVAVALASMTVISIVSAYFVNQARVGEQRAKFAATEYKDDALDRYRVAKELVDRFVEDTQGLEDNAVTADLHHALLQKAEASYRRLGNQHSSDPNLELERMRALVRVADTLMLQGRRDESLQRYQQVAEELNSREVVALFASAERPWLRDVELARTLVRQGIATMQGGDVSAGRQRFIEALAIYQPLTELLPQEAWIAGNHAVALANAAYFEQIAGNNSQAIDYATQSQPFFEIARQGDDRRFDLPSVESALVLGRAYRSLGEFDKANQALQKAEDQLDTLIAKEPDSQAAIMTKVTTQISIAAQYQAFGNFDAALDSTRDAILVCEEALNGARDSFKLRELLVQLHTNSAVILWSLDERDAAIENVNLVRELAEGLLSRAPGELRLQEALAVCNATEGRIQMELDPRQERARNLLEDSCFRVQQLMGLSTIAGSDRKRELVRYISYMAQLEHRLGNVDAGRKLFADVIGDVDLRLQAGRLYHAEQHEYACILYSAGLLESDDQQLEQAEALFGRAIENWEAIVKQGNFPVYEHALAECYLDCAMPTLRDLPRALALAAKSYQSVPTRHAFASTYAYALAKNGQYAEAQDILAGIRERHRVYSADDHLTEALVLSQSGDPAAAETAVRQAEQYLNDHFPYRDRTRRRLAFFTAAREGTK